MTTSASTAVRMIPAIPKALFTVIDTAVQMNKCNTDLGGYADMTRGIINKILRCKNMLNKLESL